MTRLDQELVRRGLFSSRSAARNAIREGHITVGGDQVRKPARSVDKGVGIEVAADVGDYVGRGAHKLLAALDLFPVEVAGSRAVDVGASTGGFTQVLLEAGAASVVALDVGREQLHQRLRDNSRVVVLEGTNVRDVTPVEIGGPFDVVTADLSFISLKVVAADLAALGGGDCDWLLLVKPQFEVGRDGLSKDGLVLSPDRRAAALDGVLAAFAAEGLVAMGAARSPIRGGSGNIEALLWLRRGDSTGLSVDAFKVLEEE